MMYVNLFWVWGHPEVYILILPAFGVFSEVIATFSGKPLFGYRSMVAATMAICVLSFLVWLHHFFTMGASADVNGFFGIMTMIIAVPTGVKVFNWLFTMYGGRVRFDVPMLWSLGFMVTFVIGGMTGVLLAVPPADFLLHNSLFLVAHFHNVIIGGVVFGAMAGYNYWFPKAFGFTLDERWGKAAFWCWLVGFYLAFMPLYALGPDGHDPAHAALRRSAAGSRADGRGGRRAGDPVRASSAQIVQLVVSIRTREQRRDLTGDPWDGRTLEWSTPSPPPAWNFAAAACRRYRRLLGASKQRAREAPATPRPSDYEPIDMPTNSRHRFRHRLLRRRHRLCPDLAHLVDGRASGCSGRGHDPAVFAWREHGRSRDPGQRNSRQIDRAPARGGRAMSTTDSCSRTSPTMAPRRPRAGRRRSGSLSPSDSGFSCSATS